MSEEETYRKNEIEELSDELTYRHYIMYKGKVHELFKNLSIPEYIAMRMVVDESRSGSIYSGRTYLKDLSEKMHLTIRQTSKMVGELRDRGLVLWSHDGNGKEGTFVTITETGQRLFEEQKETLKKYYEAVIKEFGKENLIELLNLMRQLDTVMSSKVEDMEVEEDGRSDEIND